MKEYYKKIETNGAKNLDEIGMKIAGYYDEEHSQNYYIDNGELYIEFPKDWEDFDNEDKQELLNFIEETINKTPDKSTTIRVKKSTKIKLDHIGERNETFDEIINRLIENYSH